VNNKAYQTLLANFSLHQDLLTEQLTNLRYTGKK
jgi:hypothetical protein